MSKPCEVFVSYSRHDQDRVRGWVNRLREGGIEVFFDTESLVGGSEWREDIVDAINLAKAVIFVASQRAFSSDYVPKELALAEQAKKYIVPIFLDKTEPTKKAAFILADLHRISAADKTDDEIWGSIIRALEKAGVQWTPPAPSEPVSGENEPEGNSARRRKRDDSWLEWDASNPKIEVTETGSPDSWENERRASSPVEEETTSPPEITPVAEVIPPEIGERVTHAEVKPPEVDPFKKSESAKPKRPRAKVLMVGGVALMAVSTMWVKNKIQKSESSASPAATKTVERTTPPPKPPPAKPKPLRDLAVELTTQYYEAPTHGDIHAQASHLADPLVDYFGVKNVSLAKVHEELTAYAKIWPTQNFRLMSPVKTLMKAPHGPVECEASIEFSSENSVARQSGSFQGRITVDVVDGEAKIVSVNQVDDSRTSAPPTFKREGQSSLAVKFVREAALSGNSSPPISAEAVADMFVEEPFYYGQKADREVIISQTNRLHERFSERRFEILEGPVVMHGLETPHVTVRVKLYFEAYKKGETKPSSGGTVTSVYILSFSSAGTPLISSVEEIDRTPL
jgi:hypothetical protein